MQLKDALFGLAFVLQTWPKIEIARIVKNANSHTNRALVSSWHRTELPGQPIAAASHKCIGSNEFEVSHFIHCFVAMINGPD